MKVKIVEWDWKEDGIKNLIGVLLQFGVCMVEVNTGADSVAVVISDSPISANDAQVYYDAQS